MLFFSRFLLLSKQSRVSARSKSGVHDGDGTTISVVDKMLEPAKVHNTASLSSKVDLKDNIITTDEVESDYISPGDLTLEEGENIVTIS